MRKQFIILLILVFIFGLAPVNFSKAEDLGGKLKGRILLQVESKGEAWYIDPGTQQRAYLGRPADAFRIMRELGLGISEKNFNSYNGYAPKNLSGRILLRVEAKGEAYYVNPTDLKMYYLGRPADAFKVMREKGLGITDEDLNKVTVFQKYKEQTEANTNAIDLLNKKISELEEKINNPSATTTPVTTQCLKDNWVCTNWGSCSNEGIQKRVCSILEDCPNIDTPMPATTQNCSPASNQTSTTTGSTLLQITNINIIPSLTSATIEWQTDKPAQSKIFLTGGSLGTKVFNSSSGLSMRHLVNITGLTSGTSYSYEIESIADGQATKKQESFLTKEDVYTISIVQDKSSVPATGWTEVNFEIATLKNGQIQTGQSVSLTTPDSSQNKQYTNNQAGGKIYFSYRPKTVGIHTLTFSWNGISERVDIYAFLYNPTSPRMASSSVVTYPDIKSGMSNENIVKFTIENTDVYDPVVVTGIKIESNIGGPLRTCTSESCYDSDVVGNISVVDIKSFVIRTNYKSNPGSFYVTINSISAKGSLSGNSKNVESLPLTINFDIK